MGYVKNEFAREINCAASDVAKMLAESYLLKKIPQRPSKKGDDCYVQQRRLQNKVAKLGEKLNSPEVAYGALRALEPQLRQVIYDVRKSEHKARSGADPWTRCMAQEINLGDCRPVDIQHRAAAYLFSHIDIHTSVESNIERMQRYGAELRSAVAFYKPFVEGVVAAYSDPTYLAMMHTSKSKSEYAKWAKGCADDINFTDSPRDAKFVMESYFWEKLRTDHSLDRNRQHLGVKLNHLQRNLLQFHDLALYAHQAVTDEPRLSRDLEMKVLIDSLDWTIDRCAENALVTPPSTSGKDLQVVLNYIAMYYSTAYCY